MIIYLKILIYVFESLGIIIRTVLECFLDLKAVLTKFLAIAI
jgi:hypothetical protein